MLYSERFTAEYKTGPEKNKEKLRLLLRPLRRRSIVRRYFHWIASAFVAIGRANFLSAKLFDQKG